MYFTTLIKNNRFADKYLEALAGSGKLVSRNIEDHKESFRQVGLNPQSKTIGNMLIIT
ncbi:hypothetical protein JWJ90_07025 [Desulfobulbus rhabdoformis]|uniref:hypothetical protein n=1 Tax=Desulfobulbus rhabdoformis TaxID=34032 RepID=UPI001962FDC9|nr:hypothetical protein [Desulfobulbus rhabdoformis]MBM9614037.1 hypothetical protein [Desulfobulbus rhabdoformis]